MRKLLDDSGTKTPGAPQQDGHISDSSCHQPAFVPVSAVRLPSLPFDRDVLRHAPAVLEGILVLLLAVQAARLAWMLFTPVGPLGPVPAGVDPASVPPLAGLDPFRAGAGAEASTPSGVEGWRLFGLRTGSDGGAAILGREGGPQRAYRPGEELAPGLVLEQVASGHVALRDGSIARRIDLPQAGTLPRRAPATPATLPGTAPAAASTAADVDPARLLGQSGLRHTGQGDGSAGYTVMPQADGSLLRQAGLRPGDVLLRVNGQPLAPGTFAEVAAELQRNPRAKIDFRRDGRDHSITLGSGTPP